MGLDDTVNLERLATAFEKIATALDRLVTVEERRFPPEKPKSAAEIIRPDADKREQFSDKGTAEWFNETEQAAGPSRFQKRFEEENPGKSAEKPQQKRRSVTPVH